MVLKVQSVIINKDKFTKREANKWIKDNKYINKKVDITKNYYRFRQFTPKKGDKYRTKDLKNGVKLVLKIN